MPPTAENAENNSPNSISALCFKYVDMCVDGLMSIYSIFQEYELLSSVNEQFLILNLDLLNF